MEKAREILPTVTFIQRDCSKLLLDLGTFDLIFSNAFVQWLPNQEEFITNAFAMMNENGIFAAQIPLFEEMPANRCIIKAEELFADKFKCIKKDKYVLHFASEYFCSKSENKIIDTAFTYLNKDTELFKVVNKEYRNRGFATEAANALIEYAFNILLVEKVTSHCYSKNIVSERVMKKMNMRFVYDSGTRY